jgi:hypothetical protein
MATTGTITTSSVTGVVKAEVFTSSIIPSGAVPSETPHTISFPITFN